MCSNQEWVDLYRTNLPAFYRETKDLPDADRDRVIRVVTAMINEGHEAMQGVPLEIDGGTCPESAPESVASKADLKVPRPIGAATRAWMAPPPPPRDPPRLRLLSPLPPPESEEADFSDLLEVG